MQGAILSYEILNIALMTYNVKNQLLNHFVQICTVDIYGVPILVIIPKLESLLSKYIDV